MSTSRTRIILIVALVFAAGLGVGISIRAALVEGTSWCRNVDYGNLPQYLTIILGIALGVFTILGVRTAQKSYKISRDAYLEDVRTSKYAQARRVYAEVNRTLDAKTPGTTYLIATTDPQAELVQFMGRSNGTHIEIGVAKNHGTYSITPKAPVKIFLISVHNDSDELISKVQATLRDGGKEIAGSVKGGRFIPPGKMVEKVLLVPSDDAPDAALAEVAFRDATGLFWRRDGAEPVEEIEPY